MLCACAYDQNKFLQLENANWFLSLCVCVLFSVVVVVVVVD